MFEAAAVLSRECACRCTCEIVRERTAVGIISAFPIAQKLARSLRIQQDKRILDKFSIRVDVWLQNKKAESNIRVELEQCRRARDWTGEDEDTGNAGETLEKRTSLWDIL
jgi:hypothetical protein